MIEQSTVLLTGFGPFPGVGRNATAELVPAIAATARGRFPETEIIDAVLPVTWAEGPEACAQLVAKHNPDLILHFGVSDNAAGFVIETVAQNACVAAPDADGELPPLELLDLEAKPDLASTVPCEAIGGRLRELGLPVEMSTDAGGYLCNAVLFNSLNSAAAGVRIGFVHVPTALAEGYDGLSMDEAVRGGLEIVAACLEDENRPGPGVA